MPYLKDLKAQVDVGRTAKHRQWRSILHFLVRKELGFYACQGEGYKNEQDVVIVKPRTTFYPSWEELENSFDGFCTDDEWVVCDDRFTDYLPADRRNIPEYI